MLELFPAIRKTWMFLNILCATLSVTAAVGELFPLPAEGLGGAAFYLFAAFLFGMVALGLGLRKRWLVAVPAVPLFLIAVMFTLLIAAGGWIWGTENARTMSFLIGGGLAVAALQVVGPFLVHRAHPPASQVSQEP